MVNFKNKLRTPKQQQNSRSTSITPRLSTKYPAEAHPRSPRKKHLSSNHPRTALTGEPKHLITLAAPALCTIESAPRASRTNTSSPPGAPLYTPYSSRRKVSARADPHYWLRGGGGGGGGAAARAGQSRQCHRAHAAVSLRPLARPVWRAARVSCTASYVKVQLSRARPRTAR